MSWDLRLQKPTGELLGSGEEVVRRISAAVPAIEWWEEPSVLEQIKDVPDHSFHQLLPTWSEELRASFSRRHLKGRFTDGQLVIDFYGFESEPIRCVHAEVRGNGDPIGLLAAICQGNGWLVIDEDEGKTIELGPAGQAAWEQFREYRAQAIRDTKGSGGDSDRD